MPKAYSYIRFSTPDQATGDSMRRQKEAIENYLKSASLEMAEDGEYEDLGKSGFRGDNLNHGLGRFIDKIKNGSIESGSVLIVESIDRLSRQTPLKALNLLLEIIGYQIKIVTLDDGGIKVYDNNVGIFELIILLTITHRAHNESQVKSERISSAWNEKRKNVTIKKMTSKCPLWLKINADKTEFETIPERVKVVQLIYQLSSAGWGRGKIVKKLNTDKIDSFSEKGKGWQVSSIEKILKSRAVIGFFQPHKIEIENGKKIRVPVGEEVANYYPAIITESEFNSVKYRDFVHVNRIAGRQGETLSNLLTGIVYCGFCHSKMTLVNKGKNPKKGGKYLACSKSIRGLGCKYRTWSYPDIESLVLAYVRNIDYENVLKGSDAQNEFQSLTSREISVLSQLDAANRKLTKYQNAADISEEISQTIMDGLLTSEKAIKALTNQLNILKNEKEIYQVKKASVTEFAKNLICVLDEIDSSPSDKKYELRMRIHRELTKAVTKIIVYPRTQEELKINEPIHYRGFRICFVGGGSRSVWIEPKGRIIEVNGETKYEDKFKKMDLKSSDSEFEHIDTWADKDWSLVGWDNEDIHSYV